MILQIGKRYRVVGFCDYSRFGSKHPQLLLGLEVTYLGQSLPGHVPTWHVHAPSKELMDTEIWQINTKQGVTSAGLIVEPVDDSPEMLAWCEYDQEEDL